jgi:beta-lactamase regulating signal transducer with metallopeptidase domain
MTIEHLLSAYIDTNVVLITVAIIWFGVKYLVARSPLRTAYQMQLHLLYALVAMVVLSPFLTASLDVFQRLGVMPAHSSLSLSDFLVSQYLHGNIALAPTEFERVMMWRTEVTHEIASLSSWLSYVVLGGLIGGFCLIVVRNARDTLYLMKMIRNSYVLRRVGRIDIRFTHETRVPFSTRGFFRHYVVLPTDLLAHQNDVRIAVSHEIQHVRQHDLTWEIVLELIRPFFFWNPAFAHCKRDIERLRELACDQQVLAKRTHPVRAYCECLLRVCRTSLTGDRTNQIITPSVPFVQIDRRMNASHSGSFLKLRIISLLDGNAGLEGRRFGTAIIILSVIATLSATIALRPTTDWSHDRLMLSTIVNLERLNTRTVTP